MPDYFTEEEAEKWHELVTDLREMGVLSSECRELLISNCCSYGGWMRAARAIKRTGATIKCTDRRGNEVTRPNPLCIELHKYRDQMTRLLPEFGLTPASRGRLVSMKSPEELNPITQLFERFHSAN